MTTFYAATIVKAEPHPDDPRSRARVTIDLVGVAPNIATSVGRYAGEMVALLVGELTTEGIAGACRAAGTRSRTEVPE